MTVARQGSPILDPDLRSQPLRGCAPTKTLSGEAAVNLKNPRGESPVKPQNPHARQGVSISKKSAHLTDAQISLFYRNQFDFEIQFLPCHFMIGVKSNGGISLCCHLHRETLAHRIRQHHPRPHREL